MRQAVFFCALAMSHARGKTDDSRWELAHTRMADGLDAYGECRGSERTQFVSMSAWLIHTPLAQPVRAADLKSAADISMRVQISRGACKSDRKEVRTMLEIKGKINTAIL